MAVRVSDRPAREVVSHAPASCASTRGGRTLAVHSAAGYEERGVGLTISLGNPGGEGLSLSMSRRWGDAATGGDALRPQAAGTSASLLVDGLLSAGWILVR